MLTNQAMFIVVQSNLNTEAECNRGQCGRGTQVHSCIKWWYMVLESGKKLTLNTHKLGHLQSCFKACPH